MTLDIDHRDLDKITMVGDKILVKPKSPTEKTKSGLFLPPGVHEKEPIHSGYVLKVGPGYPIPNLSEDDPYLNKSEVKYLPLQPREGDLAVYLPKSGFEIVFNDEKYLIIQHSAILMLIRDEGLFE